MMSILSLSIVIKAGTYLAKLVGIELQLIAHKNTYDSSSLDKKGLQGIILSFLIAHVNAAEKEHTAWMFSVAISYNLTEGYCTEPFLAFYHALAV